MILSVAKKKSAGILSYGKDFDTVNGKICRKDV